MCGIGICSKIAVIVWIIQSFGCFDKIISANDENCKKGQAL